MSPEQISRLADVMTADPDIMAILKGDEEDVDGKVQEGLSESVRPHNEATKKVVGGVAK